MNTPTHPLMADTATARPWRVFTTPDGLKLVGIGSQEGEGILDAGFGVWAWNDPEGLANANLVVESVNAISPSLDGLKKICRERGISEVDGIGFLIAEWVNLHHAGDRK